jgi:thiol:disulfide interchange protein DsbC
MKKILLSMGIVASLFASDHILNQKEALEVIKNTPLYNQIKPRLSQGLKVKGDEKKDFYIITIYDARGEGNFFITKDKKYTILGNVLDNQTKKPLKANYPAEPFKGNKQIVKDGVLFSFGSGKKDLYIVTDPECPFCQRFEKMAKNTDFSKKYRIHVIFLPLPFHKHSMAMIDYILSAPTEAQKVQRFHETLQGSNAWKDFKPTKAQKEMVAKEIAKSKKAVEELGAKGTPTFFDENMKEIKDRGSLFK